MAAPSWIALLLSPPVLTFALVVATGAAETGLLVLNRYLLLKGVFKFPYPFAVSLVQCFTAYISVLVAEYPFRVLLALLTPTESASFPEGDKEALLYKDDSRGSSPTRILRGLSPRRFGFRSSTNEQSPWQDVRKALPLTLAFLLKVVLGNIFITYLTLPAVTLLQIAGVPIAFVINAITHGESHSIVASVSAVVAVSCLFLTVLPKSESFTVKNITLGLSLSTVEALLPVLIWRTCRERRDAFPPDTDADRRDEDWQTPSAYISQMRQGASKFWPVLRTVSLLSTITLIPIALFTGEVRHILNDSYVLTMPCVRQLIFFSGVLNGTFLVAVSLLVLATSPVTTSFLAAFTNAIQIGVFVHGLHVSHWLGLAGCWLFSVFFVLSQLYTQWRAGRINEVMPSRNTYSTYRNVAIIVVLCVSISLIGRVSYIQSKPPPLAAPSCNTVLPSALPISRLAPVKLSLSASKAHDDYLGARPDVDTIADMPMILERCVEIEGGLGVDDVINCAKFLAQGQDEYFSLPEAGKGQRASERNPQEYALDVKDTQNVLSTHFVKPSEAEPASKSSIGTCPGPVFPYHVYWTGPATWRLELFVKAYLYTQNLPCSRLWLWLDSETDANAVERMLCDDPIFRRFLPLVDRGDVVVKAWNFPERIPIPNDVDVDSIPESFRTTEGNDSLGTHTSNSVIHDGSTKWLVFDRSLAHFTAVQVSDLVRFVVLHVHGGVYFDMDVMLLRDMRPLLIQPHSFAEQWVERCPIVDFNTAVISVPANSSLSTYLVGGGVRMGMNFHPKVIGRMMLGDGRIDELKMLQNAVFDPLVTYKRRRGTTNCTVPCLKNFEQVFRGEVDEPEKEWSNYYGESNERSLDKFFRGSFSHHIHNHWKKFPEPNSWMDVITRAQDGFFEGSRTNAYGEKWKGPMIADYDHDTWN